MPRKKLAILATHPIQYQAAWFRALASHADLDIQVYFGHTATAAQQSAAGFGVEFDWDVPLLDGYPYAFLKNVSKYPSAARFKGIDTPEIAETMARERYDAILINGWHYKGAWQAMWCAWRTKTPIMLRGDSHLWTPRSWLKRAVKSAPYRVFISRADVCLAPGSWSRDYFLHYGASPERVFHVPHAIHENWVAKELEKWDGRRTELRRRWGLDDEAVVFIFVGKFIPIKRPMDFVRAVALVAKSGVKVAGLMVGDGILRPDCETLAREQRVPVQFTGFLNQSEIMAAYVAGDVLVLPSERETWGLVVNEAMACGRPAIVSAQVGCGPDLIDKGTTGDLFPSGDVDKLATLMSEWSVPGRCRSSREIVQKKIARYSVEQAVQGTLQALRYISSQHQRPATSRAPYGVYK